MSIGIYIIEYSEIELKLRDFVDSYSDLNGHFLISEVNKGSLLTIYTDQNVNNLALELQVPVAKLHKIDQSSRRKSPIKLTLFAFDDIELEVSENLIGKEIYKQYNQLRKKNREDLEKSLNQSKAEHREKLKTSNQVKEETLFYSEEDLTLGKAEMDLSGVKEFLIPK